MKKIAFAISTFLILVTTVSAQTEVTSSSLKDQVTVRRDTRSIPYIEARNDEDLYFVQGYVTASDRLWQMDLMRRVARGETAEIFGGSTLEEDKRWRRYGFAKLSEESIAYLSPSLRTALENYARGVNAYIASLDDKTLPIEFRILQYKPREWTAADSIVIGKILAEALSSTWRNDILRATLQNVPQDKLKDLTNQVTPYDVVLFGKDSATRASSVVVPPSSATISPSLLAAADLDERIRASSLAKVGLYAEDLAASNNWVISGKRTADGKPLLANDPHLLPTTPGIWYLTHLTSPTMRVSGVTFPGVPGIVLGHNEHFAWGATNVGPDVQDLYEEKIVQASGDRYRTPAGDAKLEVREETIFVRENPLNPAKTAKAFKVEITRHGPIILEQDGKKYALKWTALDPKNSEFEAFYNLNRAKDWNGFKDALRTYGGATQNFVYADTKGNIGWYAAGRIPIRKSGDGAMPYDGSTDDGEWTGYIPFDELPNLYNPTEGFIVTANQRIVGTSYRYTQISRDAASPWRARRIYDMLKPNNKVTMDDVAAVQLDAHNIPLTNLAKEIVKQPGGLVETISLMKSWDGNMTPDSQAALRVNEIRLCLANKMADDNKPVPATIIRERVLDWAVREKSARWLPKPYADYPALLKACDLEVADTLTKRLGADRSKWIWATASTSRFPHPLAVAPLIGGQFATPAIGISGSGQTPNVASYVSMRHIAAPGNWDTTRHVIPLGQSGNPQSRHYKDQFDLWRAGATSATLFPFSKAAVEAATTPELIFRSGK
jgi:penicillin amidase